jgi:hypothetical protein
MWSSARSTLTDAFVVRLRAQNQGRAGNTPNSTSMNSFSASTAGTLGVLNFLLLGIAAVHQPPASRLHGGISSIAGALFLL